MLLNRRPCSNEAPMFGDEVSNFSANEVAEATMRSVNTIRWSQSAYNLVELVKAMSEATKGNRKQAVREEMLQDITSQLLEFDFVIFRRRIVPDVIVIIRTGSFVSTPRKDKVVQQFKELVSALDRVLG